jgi:ABC-type nickel/cobalt efflux system permease component RcnA
MPESTAVQPSRYARHVSLSHATAMTALRASLLLLLVLGLVVRPVLNHVGELHGIEHAATAAAEHGHDHPGDDAHGADHDSDHAKGTHGLLHQADAGAANGILIAFWVSALYLPKTQVPALESLAEPRRLPSTPFRPPIA